MVYRYISLLIVLLVAGCATGGPRVQFMSAAQVIDTMYAASLQKYVNCHNAASDLDGQDDCFNQKMLRGERINETTPLLAAFGNSIIATDQIPDGTALQRSLVVLSSMRLALMDELSPDQQAAMAYLDAP